MEIKLDSVLTGWVLAGVVIFLAVISAIVGAAGEYGGFDAFLYRLAPPLGVGILIIAATATLKGVRERRSAAQRSPGGSAVETARPAASDQAGQVPSPAPAAPDLAGEAPSPAAAPDRAETPAQSVPSGEGRKFNLPIKLSIGGIIGSIAGVFVIIGVFIPWVALAASYGGETEVSPGVTLLETTSEGEFVVVRLFFFLLLALGIVGLASAVLPRWTGLIIGIVGMAMTLITYIYIFAVVGGELRDFAGYGVTVLTVPHIGFFLTGASFLALTVLRAIRRLNRPLNLGADGD